MQPIHLISFIICLIVSAVLMFMGIYGLVNNQSLVFTVGQKDESGIAEWVMIGLSILLLIFSVWSFITSLGTVHLYDFFGARKIETPQGETSVVPPEKLDEAVEKFESATGIKVGSAKISSTARTEKVRKSPKKSSRFKKSRR